MLVFIWIKQTSSEKNSEVTKGVIMCRISKKYRQYNSKTKTDQGTDVQNIPQKKKEQMEWIKLSAMVDSS